MMDTPTLLALATFAGVNSITPGPNNLMLLASGVRHGFRASVPHMLGISIGFGVLMLVCALGLGALFERWPAVHEVLRWVGIGYLLWLAWKLWHADAPKSAGNAAGESAAPMSFLGAALFQWVNPKAWMMAIGAAAGFMAADGGVPGALWIAFVCSVVNLPCISVWALGGARLSRWLGRPAVRQRFNAGMAALLAASVYPMLGG